MYYQLSLYYGRLFSSFLFKIGEYNKAVNLLENEKQLLKAAKNGDEQAFRQIYEFYFPKIYSYIIKRCGHQQTAEDITSQVFLKAFTKLPGYRITRAPFGAWVFKIATNSLTDHYRKNPSNVELSSDTLPEFEDNSSSADDHILLLENKQKAYSLLSVLSKDDQHILQLRFFAELSVKEVAQVLKVTENAASVRIYRALNRLKKSA